MAILLTLGSVTPAEIRGSTNTETKSFLTNKKSVSLCPALSFFDVAGSSLVLYDNNSKFCNGLQKTCCSEQDFEKLKSFWEDSLLPNDMSRVDIRASKMSDIALFTQKILSNYDNLIKHSMEYIQHSDKECFEAATEFSSHKFDRAELDRENYLSNAQQCFDYVSDINTSLLCAACDPEVQSSIDFESKSVLLNAQALLDFKKSCLSFVNLNIMHLYPFLQQVQKLVFCKSAENPMYPLNNKNMLTEEQMEDAEFIFSKSVSFGAETNVNAEGDFRYITELYQKMVKVVDMTGDTDFTLTENSESNSGTQTETGLAHNRRLGFVGSVDANLNLHEENQAKKYKRYLRAKANGDMVRMEKVHIMQKALNMQEQREVALLDSQWRNRMRRARRLTQRIFDIDDESLEGNKPVFTKENGDKLFIKRLPARRLAGDSDTNEGDDESDGDDGEKSDSNDEDDDDEDSDDGDENTPDIKKRIENLNEICTYHWWQGDFLKQKECWVKDNKDIKKYVKNLLDTLKCMDEEATKKDSDGDNTITKFKKTKKCLEKGDQAKKNKDEEEDDKKTKEKEKKDKKKSKDKKKTDDKVSFLYLKFLEKEGQEEGREEKEGRQERST